MKKLTSILAALLFAITAVFAQESKSVEIDLVAGTVKSGLSKSIVWTTDSIQITQESRSLTGTQGAAGAVDVTDVSKPKLTDGQNFVFKTTSLAYPQIINIDITYEGTNYGGLVVGTTRSGGLVVADPKCVTTPSTAENGTHKIKIIGGAQQLYVQNYNATPLHVTKIVVTCAVAGYVEQEEAQTDTATVTSMQEVIAALGTRTKVVVLYKNLKPITKTSGQFFDDYMPDGTTKLNMSGYTLPADFDCYGTYSAADARFTVDSITDLHAFANPYLLKNYYESNKNDANILSPLNITEPVIVTAVEGNNVFVQYRYARDNNAMYSEHLVINGNHTLKVGDQIATFAAKYNKKTSLTLDEENTVLVRNEYFAVDASSLGTIIADNAIKYSSLSNITNLTSNAAKAVQLPAGGIIAKKDSKYFYIINNDSLEMRLTAGVDAEPFVGKEMNLAIKGVVDYCNTADYSATFIANSIKEINTNYESIAQWLNAAAEGEGEGSLKNPVIVTHSEFKNSKQFIFIGDATGGLCLMGTIDQGKIDSIKTGDVLSGISGKLDLSTTTKTPQIAIPNNLTVIDSLKTLEPVEVTIEELLKEENDAINNGRPAIKYANRLVKITKVKKSASWVKNNPRFFGLIQENGADKDTLIYSTNTLNAYHTSVFSSTTPMNIVGVVDFRCINANNLYSIYPRSTEDIKDGFDAPVISPAPGTYYTDELEITISCSDPATTAIYYTFDPEIDPTLDECETYEAPFSITKDTTIWYAVEYGDRYSEVFSASYKVRPESEKVVTATWNIEEGQVLEAFENVTVTFAGIDSVGRELGVDVTEVVSNTSSVQTLYSVAEDGTATAVGILPNVRNGLSVTYSVAEDKGYNLVEGKLLKNGNYRIVIPQGALVFNPRRIDENGNSLPVVKNRQEYVLNFSIKNDYKEKVDPVEVDAAFTANPADNSTVSSISEIVVTFTDKTSVTINEVGATPRPDQWPFLNQVMVGGEDEELGGSISGMSQAVAPMLCEVAEGAATVRFYIASEFINGATEITTEGSYTLTIPAGLIAFSETEINKAITLNYTIKGTDVDVEVVTTENIYTIDGTIIAEGEFQIFTVTGQDVTNMNGRLTNGIYVVRTANTINKVIVK